MGTAVLSAVMLSTAMLSFNWTGFACCLAFVRFLFICVQFYFSYLHEVSYFSFQ